MKQTTIDLLRQVAHEILSEKPTGNVGFNMAVVEDRAGSCTPDRSRAGNCGTVRCIGGWIMFLTNCPRRSAYSLTRDVIDVLDEPMGYYEGFRLLLFGWTSNGQSRPLVGITAQEAADAIECFIATDGRESWT